MRTRLSRLDQRRFGPWALVTGASSGIGREVARHLAASGINLILAARRGDVLDTLGAELNATYGIAYRAVAVDLSESNAANSLIDATNDVDIGLVVSNAGDLAVGELLSREPDTLLRELRLNSEAHLVLIHHFGRRLVGRGRGGILLVSSMYGIQGVPHAANYAAAKAYLLTLGEAVHHELARHGVTVTVLLPGPTTTPLAARLRVDATAMRPMLMPVEACVREGLAALAAGRATRIAGRMNRLTATLAPRTARIRIFGAVTRTLAEQARNAATD